MKQYSKQTKQHADCSVMESGNHFKNGVSPKSLTSRGNLKSSIILALIFLFSINIYTHAQTLPLMDPRWKESLIPIKGGEEGKSYAIIVNTSLSKKELVDNTTKFLAQWNLVDLKNVKLDEISDAQSEYTIPVELRQAFTSVSVMMGMPSSPFAPFVLSGDLRFEFHDNGNVMIVFANFKEVSFYPIDKTNTSFIVNDTGKDPLVDEYMGQYTAATMENTFLLKALIVLNKGIDGLKEYSKSIDNYFKDVDSKFELFSRIEKSGKGAWLTDEQYLQYAKNTKAINNDKYLSWVKQYLDEGRLLAIPKKRWEDRVIPLIDQLFKAINISLNGTIEGVAEDGDQTYINMDGTVLPIDPKWKDKTPPTDPKERENYIKKNKKKEY